jgi:DNA mismatch endonuclease (patch repair protein)
MEALLKKNEFDYVKYPKIFGRPDFLVKPNILIFCDSGFWHGRNWNRLKAQLQKGSNPEYWVKHISKNRSRGKYVTRKLRKEGYVVLRFWDDEVFKDNVIHRIRKMEGQTDGEIR